MEMLRFATAGSVDDGKTHPDRAPAPRLEADLRGPAGGRRAHQPRQGVRLHQPRAAHRRPAGRAGAGHHDRRRLPLLRHAQAQVHHRRHPGPRAVHAEHGDRRLDRRPRARARRRPQGHDRAEPASRRHRLAAAGQAPRGVRQQDGPRRLRREGLRGDPRRVHRVRRQARVRRPHVHPDLGPARRQRHRALAQHAVVRRAHAAVAPGEPLHRLGPQPDRPPVPGAVRHPAACPTSTTTTGATPGRWPAAQFRAGDEVLVLPSGLQHDGRVGRPVRRPDRRGLLADVASRSASPTRSTSAAAT